MQYGTGQISAIKLAQTFTTPHHMYRDCHALYVPLNRTGGNHYDCHDCHDYDDYRDYHDCHDCQCVVYARAISCAVAR